METLYPGTFLNEIKGQPPVEGVSTSTAGFVGIAERGPIGEAGFVTSFDEYVALYGGYLANSALTYAVYGYFLNGGSRAYISRAVHFEADNATSKKASANLGSEGNFFMLVDSLYDGTYGNKLSVKIENYDNVKKTFDLRVLEGSVEKEAFKGLDLLTIEALVNGKSRFISVTVLDDEIAVSNGTTVLEGGVDGIAGIAGSDYDRALKAFDNVSVRLIAVPGMTDDTVKVGAVAYANKKRAVYVSVPNFATKPAAFATAQATSPAIHERHLLYFGGWGNVSDPIGVGKNPVKLTSLEGHIIGAIVRIDNTRGVWKAPAGIEAKLLGVVSLAYSVNDDEQSLLNPIGVNAIRVKPGHGIVIWGARTTDVKGDFKYVTDRRVADYVEDSILSSSDWTVFEGNDQELYDKITSTGEDFLRGFWRAGGLAGKTEDDAFFMKVGATPDQVEAGQVDVRIGIARRKPAEFIVFNFSMMV